MTALVDDPSQWQWPPDVRERLERHRIAIPKPAAPEPGPAAAPTATGEPTDPTDELLSYMFGTL